MRGARSRRATATAAALLLALAGCGSAPEETEDPALLVLLTDNQLLRVSAGGEVLSRGRLAPPPGSFASFGGLLALRPDRGGAYALIRGKRQHVAVVGRDGEASERWALPGRATWARLAVGPRTGRVYLAGYVPGPRVNAMGDPELAVRIRVLSPAGAPLADRRVRASRGHDWYPQSLTVADDESSLLVAYHGSDTTGADVVALDPLRGCRDPRPDGGACLRNHGRAEWVGGEILAATGARRLALLAPSGRTVRRLDSGLRDVHLMDFLVDGDVAYAFGNCVQGTGVARVPLAPGAAVARMSDACGDTATLLDDTTLVLGRRGERGIPGSERDAALVLVDLSGGEPDRSTPLAVDPADVVALPPP